MAYGDRKAVRMEQKRDSGVQRHPIKAAKLLYSVPRFILRGPIYLICLIAFALVVYSFWAKKDERVIAPLSLEKSSITVESIGGGRVVDVRVKPNSLVKSNELLAMVQEKVRAITETEQETIDSRMDELERERDKLIDEFNYSLAQTRLQLEDLKQNRETRKITLEGKVAQIMEKQRTTTREKALREKEYRTSLTRYERAKKRFDDRDIIITQFEAIEQEMDRRRKGVSDAEATLAELSVSLRTAEKELATLADLHAQERIIKNIEQIKSRRDREVKRMNEGIDSLILKKEKSQRLIEGVTFKEAVTEYRSIHDGLVTRVHVKKGQMLAPGTPLVTLVKDTALLEGRALVMNKDIGKIKVGQAAQIKYFAYPYQEYGVPRGIVKEIGKKPEDVGGAESKYVVKVALEKEVISPIGSDREHSLELGLEGLVEIKTGEKRWIEVIFNPISKFFTQDEDD
ncbi:MAG: HlyD family efflux transporter periplasmic adaptor subunit [Pseudomonadota bacterium]